MSVTCLVRPGQAWLRRWTHLGTPKAPLNPKSVISQCSLRARDSKADSQRGFGQMKGVKHGALTLETWQELAVKAGPRYELDGFRELEGRISGMKQSSLAAVLQARKPKADQGLGHLAPATLQLQVVWAERR